MLNEKERIELRDKLLDATNALKNISSEIVPKIREDIDHLNSTLDILKKCDSIDAKIVQFSIDDEREMGNFHIFMENTVNLCNILDKWISRGNLISDAKKSNQDKIDKYIQDIDLFRKT